MTHHASGFRLDGQLLYYMREEAGSCVPSVCRFFGITIYIYYFDHAPPHFHAVYQDMVMKSALILSWYWRDQCLLLRRLP